MRLSRDAADAYDHFREAVRLHDLMPVEFDRARTYAELDGVTAAEFLDRLAFPDRARAVLFEVFGHSFFNREKDFSAAELVANFHFYFLGNPEGLGMDVTVTVTEERAAAV